MSLVKFCFLAVTGDQLTKLFLFPFDPKRHSVAYPARVPAVPGPADLDLRSDYNH
jgi:hypothetical protein